MLILQRIVKHLLLEDNLFKYAIFSHENTHILTQIELRFGEPVNCSGHGRLDNRINTAKYNVNLAIDL